ncbi:MAG: DUF4149 domain-containing protein [Neisseriaceae bacterium]|nr:DUF4149 domain-containing protein [Neisseriaceae bacterium]
MRMILETCCIVAWLGMLLVAGYVVAPILFAHLPKMTAGNIAGELFHYVSYTGMVATVCLWFSGCLKKGFKVYLSSFKSSCLLAAFLLMMINEWLITPVIVALKTKGVHILHQTLGGSFAAWHGASQIIYLLTAICGVLFMMAWAKELRS